MKGYPAGTIKGSGPFPKRLKSETCWYKKYLWYRGVLSTLVALGLSANFYVDVHGTPT
jgi:hypothetical protein